MLVFHWNEWFFGMIYLNDPRKFPLATYLRTILIDLTSVDLDYADQDFFRFISDENSKAAQIFIGMVRSCWSIRSCSATSPRDWCSAP